jgi:hypothetical protein
MPISCPPPSHEPELRRLQIRLQLLAMTLLGLFSMALPLCGQESARVLQPNRFDEGFRAGVPVSGGIRKGVLVGSPEALVVPDRLVVELPAAKGWRLCVNIESRDGRYRAELEYSLAGAPGGLTQLQVPTRYAGDLRRYRARELAVLAFVAVSCPGKIERIVPASWGGKSEKAIGLTILINSRGDEVEVVDPRNSRTFSCKQAIGDSHLAYDKECVVPPSVGAGNIDLLLSRKSFESRLKPISLPLFLP